MIILYGYGVSNKSIERYLIKENILYQIVEDADESIVHFENVELIIKSPGIKNNTLFIKKAHYFGIKIISDIEYLYSQIINNKIDPCIISITGTNGKTTTTSILKSVLDDFYTCGNIGTGLFDNNKLVDRYLIECSSYMLEYTKTFKPSIHVILNIEKHHLSHHGSYVNYIKSKIKPLKNMNEDELFIFDDDNLLLKRIANVYVCKKESFSVKNNLAICYLKDDLIYYKNESILDVKTLKLNGIHNYKNIMASIIILKYLNIDPDKISMIKQFEPLQHRLEFFKTSNYQSTVFINDSKSTSPYALYEAVNLVKSKYNNKEIILLVGGKKEDVNYSLFDKVNNLVYKAYAFGEIASLIKYANMRFKNLSVLINYLKNSELSNKVILFSPGAPSLDEFKNYEERGEYFKNSFIYKTI